MAQTVRCTIVTPTAAVLDEEVVYASIPSWDGQMGVMPGQSPVLARLSIGSLRLEFPQGENRWYLVEGGFAQIQNDQLTLLTESATPADKLSLEEAEAELAEANARIGQSGEDLARIERDQQRGLAKKWLASNVAS